MHINAHKCFKTPHKAWKDMVEREIEQNLSLWYVFRQTWLVFLCGVAYLTYIISSGVADLLVLLIVVPWILYPISTYAAWLGLGIGSNSLPVEPF